MPVEDLGFVAIDDDLGFQPLDDDLGFEPIVEEVTPATAARTWWERISDAVGPGLLSFQRANIEASKQIGGGIAPPTEAARAVVATSPGLALLPEQAQAGLAEGAANVVSGLTTRENVALGALTIAQPEIGAALIAGLSAKAAGQKLGEASVAAEEGDTRTAVRDVTEGAAAALGVLAPLAVPRGAATTAKPPVVTEPMRAVPPGTELAQRAIEHFTPATPEASPLLRIDREHILPRLQPYETEKLLASEPHGMANVPVLGAATDPRATVGKRPLFGGEANAPADIAIITRAHSVNKGRTLAALWAEGQFRNKDLFVAADDGTIPLTNGERGYISDVIEAEIRDPGSQAISPEQRTWINKEWLPLREDVNKMLEEEGVREVTADEFTYDPATDYFPRPAIGKRNREVTPSGQTGGRPGAAPFFEKARRYETEFEGARPARAGEQKEVIIYDPDAISRATKLVVGAYRAVADHRLANDAALGGETVKARFESLKERHQARFNEMEAATARNIEQARSGIGPHGEEGARLAGIAERKEFEAQLMEQAAYPIWGKEERLNIAPAFANKIYLIESAQRLRTAYADEVRGWVRVAQNATGAAKAMMATADMSAPLVQGAAMMGRHPVLWAKSTLNSYRSLLDPQVTAKMLERPEYRAAAEEFTQSGGSLLQLQDFMSGTSEGALATRIPAFGRVVEATGRAYGTFFDLAKLELWRAWKDVTPANQWGALAESIETSLFSGRMESIGLNPHRTVGERLMLFAPSYYRGAGNLIANAFQRGVSGNMARQMIGSYAAASALITLGSWYALGLSQEDIERRLDPRRGTFLKVPVATGDGGRVEVGFGNVLTQLLRLAGQAVAYHTQGDKPIDTGVEGNPYLHFLRGRAAFLPSLAIDIATGTDFMGNPITIKEATARHFMPFALQSMFPREDTPMPARAMDAAFSFFGLNAFPESEYATQLRHMDEAARAAHGAPIFELPLAERARAVSAFRNRPDFKDRDPTMQDMRRFVKLDEERRMSLRSRLAEETRANLDKLGVDAGSYRSTLTVGGVDVPLSRAEQERYQELLAASFDQHLKKVPEEAFKVTPAQRGKWWERYAAAIRKEAREKLMTELAKPRKE